MDNVNIWGNKVLECCTLAALHLEKDKQETLTAMVCCDIVYQCDG